MDRLVSTFFLLAVIMVTVTTTIRHLWGQEMVEEWGVVILLVSTLAVVEWGQWRYRRRSS
jgi:hypothetical protein